MILFTTFFVTDLDYIYYRMRSCSGRNEIFVGSVTSQIQCREICDRETQCISFEWWGIDNPHPIYGANYCQASSSCTYGNSQDSTLEVLSDLYVKGNAIEEAYLYNVIENNMLSSKEY